MKTVASIVLAKSFQLRTAHRVFDSWHYVSNVKETFLKIREHLAPKYQHTTSKAVKGQNFLFESRLYCGLCLIRVNCNSFLFSWYHHSDDIVLSLELVVFYLAKEY